MRSGGEHLFQGRVPDTTSDKMIRIGSIENMSEREFTVEESQEMIPVWYKLTQKASDRSLVIAARYGKLQESDPEWNFLANEVNDILQDWASKVRRLGGVPRELWEITWSEEGNHRSWKLETESYALNPELN